MYQVTIYQIQNRLKSEISLKIGSLHPNLGLNNTVSLFLKNDTKNTSNFEFRVILIIIQL